MATKMICDLLKLLPSGRRARIVTPESQNSCISTAIYLLKIKTFVFKQFGFKICHFLWVFNNERLAEIE